MPMRPHVALAIALSTVCLFVGCSGSGSAADSYDPVTGLTTYRSSRIPLGRSSSAGYAAGTSLVLRAEAECRGEECAPSSYVLSVSNTGTNEVAADFNQIVFSTPEGTVSFEPGRQAESASSVVTFFSSGRGELVRLSIPADIFTSFATARDLTVRLGANEYRLPYDSRSSLRRMIPETDDA